MSLLVYYVEDHPLSPCSHLVCCKKLIGIALVVFLEGGQLLDNFGFEQAVSQAFG